jgi:hypothetical protein
MINPQLEKRFADCTELTDAWKSYLEFYNKAVKETGDITPEIEAKFMECKGTIAMLHDSFMESLKDDRDVGQNMLAIVNRSITLKHVRHFGQADKKKIEIEWHECYLQLSEIVSVLGEQREKLLKVSKTQERIEGLKETLHVGTHNFFVSVWFRLGVIVAVIAGLYIFVPWNDLRDQGTPGKWFQGVLDFGRDELSLWDAPFGSIERFNSRFMGDKAPGGYTISMDNMPSEQNFNNLLQWLDVSGQNGRDFLASREGFQSRNFVFTESNQTRTVNAGAYFWYSRARASDFEKAFRAAEQNIPPHPGTTQANVVRVHNVLIVLAGGTPDARRKVADEVFVIK